MGQVKIDISMSLDGFITGANDDAVQPLGEGGGRLHRWLYKSASWRKQHGLVGGERDQDAAIADEVFHNLGAVIMGRNMFNLGRQLWGENPPFHVPVFVITHEPCASMQALGGTSFSFHDGSIEATLRQAQAAAGDQDVWLAGGANIIQQFLSAGLVDELHVHIAPVLLGKGRRLFEYVGGRVTHMERLRVAHSPEVSHLKYRVIK